MITIVMVHTLAFRFASTEYSNLFVDSRLMTKEKAAPKSGLGD